MGLFRKSKKKGRSFAPPSQSGGGLPPVSNGSNAGGGGSGGEEGGSSGGGTIQYLGDFGGAFNNLQYGGGYNYSGNNHDCYSKDADTFQYIVWLSGNGYANAPADSWSYSRWQ